MIEETIVEEYEYTTLQDDGCPNCPEHLGDLVPVYFTSVHTNEWVNLDRQIVNSMRKRKDILKYIIGGQSKWLNQILLD